MTSSKVAEILNESYLYEGIGFETDDRLDEIVASELRDAHVEINEDESDDPAEEVYARPFIRRAVRAWADELGQEAGNEGSN